MKYGLLHLHFFPVKSAINPLKSSIYYSHVKHDLRVTNVIVEVGTNCYPLSSKSCPNIPKPPNTLPYSSSCMSEKHAKIKCKICNVSI